MTWDDDLATFDSWRSVAQIQFHPNCLNPNWARGSWTFQTGFHSNSCRDLKSAYNDVRAIREALPNSIFCHRSSGVGKTTLRLLTEKKPVEEATELEKEPWSHSLSKSRRSRKIGNLSGKIFISARLRRTADWAKGWLRVGCVSVAIAKKERRVYRFWEQLKQRVRLAKMLLSISQTRYWWRMTLQHMDKWLVPGSWNMDVKSVLVHQCNGWILSTMTFLTWGHN